MTFISSCRPEKVLGGGVQCFSARLPSHAPRSDRESAVLLRAWWSLTGIANHWGSTKGASRPQLIFRLIQGGDTDELAGCG